MGASTTIVPVLKNAAAGLGSVNVDPWGQANLVRTVPLVWNGSRGPVPSLALEALRVALGESALVLWGTEGSPGVIDAVGVGDIDIPTLPDGQIWVNFRRDNSEIFISAQSVLEKEYDLDLSQTLEGSIVFVGTSAAGLLDIRATAIGQNIPGVAIQAQIVEQIHGRLGWRPGRTYFLARGSIPRTDTGKTQHTRLKSQFLDGHLRAQERILFPDY